MAIDPSLLLTPKPYAGESLNGYLLRLAEVNGYESPDILLRGLGIGGDIRTANHFEKLARLTGRIDDFLQVLNLSSLEDLDKRIKSRWLGGHMVFTKHLLPKRTTICPDCVNEMGYIDTFWELRYAIACPTHERYTVHQCMHCNNPVSWSRPGLLTCRCGADFTTESARLYKNKAILALLGIIRAKLMNNEVYRTRLSYLGFPEQHLRAMSLDTLLEFIHRFELSYWHREIYERQPGVDSMNLGLMGAKDVLTNWPRGFHDYLSSVHMSTKTHGLRGRENSFYERFLEGKPANPEMNFLLEEFLAYGRQRWGLSGFSLKEMPKAIKPLNNLLSDKPISRDVELLEAPGRQYDLQTASEFVELPKLLLKELIKNGSFQVRHAVTTKDDLHELDLIAYKKRLLNGVELIAKPEHYKFMTFSEIKQKSMGGLPEKAALVAAIAEGKLRPIGIFGRKLANLVFERASVIEMMREVETLMEKDKYISSTQAVAELSIGHITLAKLIKDGHLLAKKGYRTEICKASLMRFTSIYVSCNNIAKVNDCGTARILRLAEVVGLSVFRIGNQPFLERRHLPALMI